MLAVDKIFAGNHHIAQVRKGNTVQFPNPVKDGLVLWYDFMGKTNSDAKRGIAEDLSGNGNDSTLTNFAHTAGSGYEDEKEYEGMNLISGAVVANDSTSLIHYAINKENLRKFVGKRITISFDALHLAEGSHDIDVYFRANNLVVRGTESRPLTTYNDKWNRYSYDFILEESILDNVFTLSFRMTQFASPNNTKASRVSIRRLKVEGDSQTPWRPAMEDPEYDEWAKDKGFKRSLRFDGTDDHIDSNIIFPFNTDRTIEICIDKGFLNYIGTHRFGRGLGYAYMSFIPDSRRFLWMLSRYASSVNAWIDFTISQEIMNNIINDENDFVIFSVVTSIGVNGNYYIYINGNMVYSRSLDIGHSHATPFQYGKYITDYYPQKLKTLKFYNRALTPEEIAHNYQMEKERWRME